jgi:heme exporter protein A
LVSSAALDLHDASPLLAAVQLRFMRNDDPVFGLLDFSVHAGEVLLVTGDNGSGKTTLLRVLAGLLPASGGKISWVGEAGPPPAERLAYLGHLHAHKSELTALENLRFAAGLHGIRPGIAPASALASVGLGGFDDALAGKFSAGQRKRLALARLLLSPALLWLLDEPYANLDREGITLVDRMLRKHLETGGAALVTTHGAYAAPPVRTRTLQLANGRIAHMEDQA